VSFGGAAVAGEGHITYIDQDLAVHVFRFNELPAD